MTNEILYLKIDRNVKARSFPLYIGDIATINCSNKSTEHKIKTLQVPCSVIKGPGRYVFSVFDLIEVIQKEYPKLEIQNLGETDFVITVEKENETSGMSSWMKTVFVCLLAFFGAAFSIMAFNNDIDVMKLFSQLYTVFTGQQSDGFTLLEISYSIGVGMGILIFFHHFARKDKSADPTPLEVEMRTYEDEIDTTLIESGNRKSDKAV